MATVILLDKMPLITRNMQGCIPGRYGCVHLYVAFVGPPTLYHGGVHVALALLLIFLTVDRKRSAQRCAQLL